MNDGIQVYVDNDLKAETYGSSFLNSSNPTTLTSGHIVLGRRLVNDGSHYGRLSVDWLTIWDRPLTEEERSLVHQN